MEDASCPLCTEDLDPTDLLLASRLCQCRFAVCLWCFRRLTEDAAKENRPPLCPGCRQPYDTERIAREGRELDPEQLEEVKRKKGKADAKKGANSSARPRKDLANVRVVQRNLVYVVGLPMECCFEEVLASQDYIGQFGKIVKISVSRTGPYGSTQAKNGPTGGAYVTFKRPEDARRCIESIHGTEWQGKLVKACYGTTKYCNSFLKGQACNNLDCLYLHDVAMDEDSYTKEETKSTKFVNLVHAASLNPAPSGLSSIHGGGSSLVELNSAFSGYDQSNDGNTSAMEEDLSDTQGWPNLSNSAWSKHPSKVLSSQQSISLTDDPQAWPGLPGGADPMSGQGTPNLSSAETSETEGEGLHSRRASFSRGATMAVKLAQSSTGRDVSKEKDPPRKLTPLPGRHRQQSSLDSGLPSVAEVKEVTGLSPPPTPQLLSNRATQKPMSPELEDREPSQQPEGSESTSQTTVYLKPEEVDCLDQNSGYHKAENSSHDSALQKVSSAQPNSLDVLQKPPPGFSGVPLRPKMGVTPPPGFADLPPVSGFTIPSYSSNGQGFGNVMTAFHSGTDGYGYGGEARQMSLGGSSQRSQSRFSFAQGSGSPTSKASRQPQWSDNSDEVFGASQWQYSQIFGGAFGPNGTNLYNTAPIQISSGYKPLQADWRDSDDLPAGLALLKRLQSQGGISRQDAPAPAKAQHSFLSDAALTPATPQNSGLQVTPEVQKTPGRRRKSKAVAA